jgi:hypothetical protein
MIYSFNIKKDFFEKLRDKIEYPKLKYVINFFEEFILSKENLFYFGDRKLISDKNLSKGKNQSLIRELQLLLEKNLKPINKLKNADVDFIFSNLPSKNTRQKTISVDEIIDIEKRTALTKYIKNVTPNKWMSNKKIPEEVIKKDLSSSLKRIFKYADKVYIVDAFLPDHLMNNIPNIVQSFKNSFKFFKDLSISVDEIYFYNGIKIYQMRKKNYDQKKLEDLLKNFYIIFKNSKAPVLVKSNKEKLAYENIYHRMFITFLDGVNIGIFTAERGLNIIKENNSTAESRIIKKIDNDETAEKLENWEKYVENSSNFIEFNTSEINI